MTIVIDNFPHAQYSAKTQSGFLCLYYPHDAVREGKLDPEEWRNRTYSPNILNFKEGRDTDLEYFVPLFLKLIEHVMNLEKVEMAHLIPLPSSIAYNDPKYSRKPRVKTEKNSRNRDDRNSVFCNLLSAKDSRLRTLDILIRKTGKKEKVTWTAEQHEKSFGIHFQPESKSISSGNLFILVDDVATHGGTLEGAAKVLQKQFAGAKIVALSLAQSKEPGDFHPLG